MKLFKTVRDTTSGLQPGTAANSNLPPHTGEHLDHRLPALGGNVISLVVPGCAAAQEYPRPPDEFKREYLHLDPSSVRTLLGIVRRFLNGGFT
ncbi:hypothetical protein FPOAC2_04535 [Fusarium poae]